MVKLTSASLMLSRIVIPNQLVCELTRAIPASKPAPVSRSTKMAVAFSIGTITFDNGDCLFDREVPNAVSKKLLDRVAASD
jgi:hypothetical protein